MIETYISKILFILSKSDTALGEDDFKEYFDIFRVKWDVSILRRAIDYLYTHNYINFVEVFGEKRWFLTKRGERLVKRLER